MKILKAIFGYKRLFIGLLAPIAFILVLIAKNNSAFAEWYTVNIYHYISQAWNFLSALLPFSLAEFIVVMLVPFACFRCHPCAGKRRAAGAGGRLGDRL